jgi:hypothetical protein
MLLKLLIAQTMSRIFDLLISSLGKLANHLLDVEQTSSMIKQVLLDSWKTIPEIRKALNRKYIFEYIFCRPTQNLPPLPLKHSTAWKDVESLVHTCPHLHKKGKSCTRHKLGNLHIDNQKFTVFRMC